MTLTQDDGGAARDPAFNEEDWREMVLRLAHEIRNPLATIKSGVQLVQHVEKPTSGIAECLASVLDEVERIDTTVGDLQRFVRIGVGHPEKAPVAALVDDAVAQWRSQAQAKGVSLIACGGPPLSCQADPGNVSLALGELLANAIQFAPPGSAVEISWKADSTEAHIRVDDEGAGIDEALADRVNRPFFSTSTKGTGLGLSIASKVCRLAGGSLGWSNLPERGCRFVMRLPRA